MVPASSTGNILFGAIDTAQYAGDLTLLDLWPEVGANDTTIQRYRVILTGVTAVSNTGSDNLGSHSLPYPALLDSGTTSTTLPDDLVAEIYMEVNATWNQQTQRASIPVDYYNSLGYLSFELGGSGGAIVNVSMKELVNPNRPGDYEDTYVFGIRPASVIGYVLSTPCPLQTRNKRPKTSPTVSEPSICNPSRKAPGAINLQTRSAC